MAPLFALLDHRTRTTFSDDEEDDDDDNEDDDSGGGMASKPPSEKVEARVASAKRAGGAEGVKSRAPRRAP